MRERFDTPKALQEKLSEILVKGSLYRNFIAAKSAFKKSV